MGAISIMNLIRIATALSTLGPIGYFGASGTVATIVTLPLVYWTHALIPSQQLYLGFIICMFAISISIVRHALKQFKRHEDPSEIVLDEVLGCLITFWGISLTSQSVLVGFLLFRALDIIKFGWVKQAESLADAWGVIGDDVVAALIANAILRLLF
jgi:phosphatidylglycerophosphatase A